MDRAYAMDNPMEYFAETSEAFFSRNDFFPYNRAELKQHDPDVYALLGELWGVDLKQETSHVPTEADIKLAGFFRSYLESDFQLSPLLASRLGDHRFDSLLDDLSSAARKKRSDLVRSTLERLPVEVNYENLSRDRQVDF